MNYGDATFEDVADWTPIIERIDKAFFYGEASYGWKKLFYGLAVQFRFPPDLYFELYAEAYHLHLMRNVKEVSRLGERWKVLGIQTLAEVRLFQHKRKLHEPMFAYVKRELKIEFFPYDEMERKIINWNEVFKFDIQLISFAISRLNQSHTLCFGSLHDLLEEWYLLDLHSFAAIQTYADLEACEADLLPSIHPNVVFLPSSSAVGPLFHK
jgi:hypothetical protein